ncbi:hypothetical protein ACJ72_07418 [Emergomyces africanus]|uniref:Uncharacterized protein n=1 Tax=Emergomyces africanus TaxID=1955775 RepID=A0A1B7NNC3_9EURO|nr:hypothetical protein ACJ72_07418 [Emergomyces africanus]
MTVRVLENEFIKQINTEKASFSEDTDKLNKDQLKSVHLCCELFHVDVMESLKKVSVSQQYRLLQAQKLLQQIYSDLEQAESTQQKERHSLNAQLNDQNHKNVKT